MTGNRYKNYFVGFYVSGFRNVNTVLRETIILECETIVWKRETTVLTFDGFDFNPQTLFFGAHTKNKK